jgi:hypothetical protein
MVYKYVQPVRKRKGRNNKLHSGLHVAELIFFGDMAVLNYCMLLRTGRMLDRNIADLPQLITSDIWVKCTTYHSVSADKICTLSVDV